MIGSPRYLVTCTPPDLAFSVSYLCRFSYHPLARHHNVVKEVCSYLAATWSIYPKYKSCATSVAVSIGAICYSDYASCCDNRRSVSSYALRLNGCAIFWLSKKQQSVVSSTTETEYMALATTFGRAVWYPNVFTLLGYKIHITIMADDTSSINVTENPINNPGTNYIDVAYHFTREYLIPKAFTLAYVLSNVNTPDLITKRSNSVFHHEYTQCLKLLE